MKAKSDKKELSDAQFKRYVNKHKPVAKGYVRSFMRCSCGKRVHIDNEKVLTRSNPIITTPCGHPIAEYKSF